MSDALKCSFCLSEQDDRKYLASDHNEACICSNCAGMFTQYMLQLEGDDSLEDVSRASDDESGMEVFIAVGNSFPEFKGVDSLVCSIFTLDNESEESQTFSLVYGIDDNGYQVDAFFKYFDSGSKIAFGDSSGGWQTSYDYSLSNQAFSEEIDPPEWTDLDSSMLENLHEQKWKYLESIEDDDDESYLVAQDWIKDSLNEYEKSDDWTAYTTEGFDDEKLSNYSDIWQLAIKWGSPIFSGKPVSEVQPADATSEKNEQFQEHLAALEDKWMEKNVINTFIIDAGGSVNEVHFRFEDEDDGYYLVCELEVDGIDELPEDVEESILNEIEWAFDEIRDELEGEGLDLDAYLGEKVVLTPV